MAKIYLGNIKGPKGDPGETPELVNSLNYDGEENKKALDAAVGPKLKPVFLPDDVDLNSVLTVGQYYTDNAMNCTNLPDGLDETFKIGGFFLEVYPFSDNLAVVGQRITFYSPDTSKEKTNLIFIRHLLFNESTVLKSSPWQSFFDESGVLSADCTATRSNVLEGTTALTSDSGDQVVDGTMVNNSVIDPVIGGLGTSPLYSVRKAPNTWAATTSVSEDRWFNMRVPEGYYDGDTYVGYDYRDIVITPGSISQVQTSNTTEGVIRQVTVSPIPSNYAEVVELNKEMTIPSNYGSDEIIFEKNQLDCDINKRFNVIITIYNPDTLYSGTSSLVLNQNNYDADGVIEYYATMDGLEYQISFSKADTSHEYEEDNDYRDSIYIRNTSSKTLKFYIEKIIKYRD